MLKFERIECKSRYSRWFEYRNEQRGIHIQPEGEAWVVYHNRRYAAGFGKLADAKLHASTISKPRRCGQCGAPDCSTPNRHKNY